MIRGCNHIILYNTNVVNINKNISCRVMLNTIIYLLFQMYILFVDKLIYQNEII